MKIGDYSLGHAGSLVEGIVEGNCAAVIVVVVCVVYQRIAVGYAPDVVVKRVRKESVVSAEAHYPCCGLKTRYGWNLCDQICWALYSHCHCLCLVAQSCSRRIAIEVGCEAVEAGRDDRKKVKEGGESGDRSLVNGSVVEEDNEVPAKHAGGDSRFCSCFVSTVGVDTLCRY